MTSDDPIPLFVDCDTGIDDALALAYLLAEPAVRVVGIGTVSGNVSAELAAANTLALLEHAGRTDIPVATGAVDPLGGLFRGGAPHVHGADGIGGIGLVPQGSTAIAAPAADLLDDLVQEWPGRLRVLALGPLTNLAHFVSTHPRSVSGIRDVVVMGGAFDRAGNITAISEANIHHDPEAAARAFETGWPLTIVPLDITMEHVLTEADGAAIGRIPGSLPPHLAAMLVAYLDFYERVFGVRQCALHDPLAAIVASGTAEILSEDRPASLRVLTAGDDRGRTVADTDQERGAASDRRIVREIAEPAAVTLLDRLSRHRWPL